MKPAAHYSKLIPGIGVVWCIVAAGCGFHSHEAEYGVPASRALSTSRIVLPAAGGQTIQVPSVMMADAYELWHPLHDKEIKRLERTPSSPTRPVGRSLTAWLPPSETDVMERYLYRLTHSRRDLAARVLARAETHLPFILESLGARGLPLELACLPMVESAFEPRAVSPAGAAGLWQLMPGTARRFGLTVSSETDERFDARKSTVAATAYLATLYGIFNDWPLALAAYNCGEGAMLRALSKTRAGSLPELTEACRLDAGSSSPLAEETLRFVPQFAAAVQIMTDSTTFGLTDHAILRLDSSSDPAQARESSLVLIGRYDTDPARPTSPARIRRIK